MNKLLLFTLLLTLCTYGCETLDTDTERGAAIGAATGAAIGGIVGHQDRHGGEGAAIGAAAGAVAGGLIGHAMDKSEASGAGYVSVVEVADMAKKGVPSSVIIDEIKRTKSEYNLTTEHIDYLRENGVEGMVVDYMLDTM